MKKEDKRPFNDKGQRHGLWEIYHYNGQLMYRCVFINGKLNWFYDIYWDDDGKVTDKRYYL